MIDFLYVETERDGEIQEEILGGKRGVTRRGYIGHVVKLGQILKKMIANKATLPEFDQDKWAAVNALV